MDFEYGCATVNKFAFLDENEVDDPSDLLAKVDLARQEQAAKKTADLKKVDAKGKKIDQKKTTSTTNANKDTNKKPLQASDNSVKKNTTDSKDTGKKFNSDRTTTTTRPTVNASGDLKENRGPRTDRVDRPFRAQGDRPPRQQEGDRAARRPQSDRPYQDRPPRQPRTDNDGNVIEQTEGETGSGYRGGYRGGRGGRGGSGYNSRGPRRDEVDGEPRRFDRHSGSEKTGIKAVDKKDGAGKGNWGSDEVVIEDALLKEGGELVAADGTVTVAAAVTAANKDWAERVDENDEQREPEEETPNFMTLEEYKALRSQVNKKNDFNVRRPGEGEDQSKWGKTYLLPKKPDSDEEEEEEEEDEEEIEDDAEEVARKELIKTMQNNFKFESTSVSSDRGRGDRGGRGGRGGDRGGRGDRPQYERREGASDRPYGERRERKPETAAAASTEESVASDVVAAAAAGSGDAPVMGDVQASPSERKFGFGERRPQADRPQGDRGQRGAASGGSRGSRGGSSRGGNQQQGGRSGPSAAKFSAPKFDDEKDFPTLGK